MRALTLFFLCFLSASALYAQTDSVAVEEDSVQKAKMVQDSIDRHNKLLMDTYKKKIAENDSLRIADSIKKADLEKRLSSLSTTDNLNKIELQKQLDRIRDREKNRLASRKAHIDSLKKNMTGFPVIVFIEDTLFNIYNRLGSFSPSERAKAIEGRIEDLGSDFFYNPDSLLAVKVEHVLDLMYNDKIILTISEDDALWNGVSQEQLSKKYIETINKSIENYKADISLWTLAKQIGLSILVIVVIGGIIFLLRRLFNWLGAKIQNMEGILFRGIIIKDYSLMDEKRQVKLILSFMTLVKWFLTLFFVYISMPIIFGIFPWTKNIAETMLGYVMDPVKKVAGSLWDYLPNLVTIIVILIVFRYVLKGLNYLKDEIEKGNLSIPGFYEDWANPTFHLIRVVVIAFMIIVIYPYLPGSESHIFQGVSVFLGFIFTISSAGSLSNIIAGLVLTYMRLFKIGDRVKIGEVTGDVLEKSLLVVRLRTTKNEIVTIPNASVMSSHSVNYSSDVKGHGLIVYTTVTISYDVPWQDMHEALIEAALRTEFLLKEPKPFVLQTSLDDFYVSYQINAYTKEPNKQAGIYSNLHRHIQDVCNEKGIEILSPHYRADRDGNTPALPKKYLPEGFIPPSFNIKMKKD